MLSRVLSNSILLVGGVAMCFYTSWRLSILAFATIGPIIHVTQVYATWSQWLNRRIYAALAAANGKSREVDIPFELFYIFIFQFRVCDGGTRQH